MRSLRRGVLLFALCGPLVLPALSQTTEQPAAPPVRVFNDTSTPPQQAPPATSTPATAQTASPASATQAPVTVGQPPVQTIVLAAPNAAALAARKSSYTVKVSGDSWTDTAVVLAPGDRVVFTVTGAVTLADGRKATADGLARGWKDLLRQFPDPASPAGGLIGRIGSDPAVVPFAIGAAKSLDVTTSGELYLRVNASSDLSPQGSYDVSIKLSRQPETEKANAATAASFTAALSPAIFANIPRRVQDESKNPGDMVNYAILGTEDQVTRAFANAGWVKVDKTTQDAILHFLLSTLQKESYTEMPMSTLYLFNRPQDLSYARGDPIKVAAIRHHLRVWKTTQTVAGKPMWVGSATHDIGFEKDQRNGGVTHKIDPDIDLERDFIEQSFAAAGNLVAAAYVTPTDPLRTARTATGGEFHSDGRIVVLDLR
ncbi:MAG: LssY C-terminal domain-containing protein [Acidobacteriaceae bacterium]